MAYLNVDTALQGTYTNLQLLISITVYLYIIVQFKGGTGQKIDKLIVMS